MFSNRNKLLVALGTGLAVLGLSAIGAAISPSWQPRGLPVDFAYSPLPPIPEPSSASDREIRREETRIQVEDTTLDATIISPANSAPHPAAVLVHGAGPGERSRLIEVAESFARSGVEALIYDKRSVVYSTATNRDFGLLADDALAAVRLLRQRDEVDPERVGLWGISEGGGWVVPIAASRAPDEVAFAVLVSAPTVSPMRQLMWQADGGLARLGAPAGLRAATHGALSLGGFDYVRHDPIPDMEKISQPVLAVYGTRDGAVPVVQSSRELVGALERGGNFAYKVRFFGGADHGMRADGGAFASGYLRTSADWIRGLPNSATSEPDRRITGSSPEQSLAAAEAATLPSFATGAVRRAALGLVVVGFLAGPVAALVGRWRTGPADDSLVWQGLRRSLWRHAVSAIATLLLLAVVLGGGVALSLSGLGSPLVMNGVWLVTRLCALATVTLTTVSVGAVVSAIRKGWRPTGVQAVSLIGSFGATGVLLLVAAYWGLFAFRW